MKKRIGMAATLCCFVVIICLIAGEERTVPANAQLATIRVEEDIVESQDVSVTMQETLETTELQALETAEPQPLETTEPQATPEPRPSPSTELEENKYANLAIADVSDYVNVRSKPGTDGEIVGKIYDDAAAWIIGEESVEWFHITSGNVEGYVKTEFFIYGDAVAAVVDEYVTVFAKVNADKLNVRKEPSTDASRIGSIDFEENVKVLEDCGEWLRVQYTEQKEGYVAAEYVTVYEDFVYAKTLEEEKADLRNAIVDYALQYVGSKYVHGGSSLATGTDCSGFTCYIYKEFGYSISRTPGGQYSSAGRSIKYSEIQPGDIICYSSNGGISCTHVAFYIGDGKIVHAANSRKGVIVGEADYSPIIGVRNVID